MKKRLKWQPFEKKCLYGLRKKKADGSARLQKKKKRTLLMKACKGIIVLKRGERCCKAGWKSDTREEAN